MDKIVEGTRSGSSGILYRDPKRRERTESFFLLDEEEQERDVFCVRSFGFDNQGFMEFYRKLRWIVPGRTRIDREPKTQEVWETATAEYRNLYGSRHAFGVCTSKTPGNDDVWVTSYERKQIRSRD